PDTKPITSSTSSSNASSRNPAQEVLYTELYKPYEGFREAKTMVDERILTRFDKLRMEAEVEIAKAKAEAAEARAKAAATEAKVARNLLKAGVAGDIILQATGLTIADIKN
ncbi:MAG: hypothetical protein LBL56_07315, partial [Treponema sp.]|nr:hypothetical protein [Treponema sp.]